MSFFSVFQESTEGQAKKQQVMVMLLLFKAARQITNYE